jgi:hypothetical protein
MVSQAPERSLSTAEHRGIEGVPLPPPIECDMDGFPLLTSVRDMGLSLRVVRLCQGKPAHDCGAPDQRSND